MNIPQQQHQEQEHRPQLVASAPLNAETDAANRVLLSGQALHIFYKGRERAFALEYLKALALEHRKLWLPLIGGGILASLCALSLLHTFNMPYRLLSGVAVGLFGVWWGLRGNMALVVYEQRHRTDFLLQRPGRGLQAFVVLANRLIRRYPQPLGAYCLAVEVEELRQLQQEGQLKVMEPRLCVPHEAHHRLNTGEEGIIILLFDPYRLGVRLHWSLQGQELQAHFAGVLKASEVGLMP